MKMHMKSIIAKEILDNFVFVCHTVVILGVLTWLLERTAPAPEMYRFLATPRAKLVRPEVESTHQ